MTNLVIYTPSAPAHGIAKKYCRNRNVWVLEMPDGVSRPTCIRDPRITRRIRIATEVDSRYSGPRSAFGRAMNEANNILALRGGCDTPEESMRWYSLDSDSAHDIVVRMLAGEAAKL